MTHLHFCIFVIISPLKWTWPFRIPFTQIWFVPSLIEIGLLVLEKKILKNSLCIFTLLQLSLLGQGQSPSFELSLVRFWRSPKCKSLQTDERTEGRTDRRTTRKAHLSFQLRWAKKLVQLNLIILFRYTVPSNTEIKYTLYYVIC
jgi:hypothetical protein